MASQQRSWSTWALDGRRAPYRKPQRSRPTRARDIAGKQRIVFQQAPAVSAKEGARHRGRAKSMVAAVQKGTAAQPCQNGVNRRIFFIGKVTARGVNFDTIVDVMAAFEAKK
jgi:hypothetical protein